MVAAQVRQRMQGGHPRGVIYMPCKSDYLEPTGREAELQKAAILYCHLLKKLGRLAPDWAVREARNIYAIDDRPVTEMCALLKTLSKTQIECIVYDAHDSLSRDLAGWWETHQKADLEREAEQLRQQHDVAVKEQAIKKLTPEERKALGVK